MNTQNSKICFTIEGAIDATGMTRTRIYAAIAEGKLKSFKDGKRRMISRKALEEYVARQEAKAA